MKLENKGIEIIDTNAGKKYLLVGNGSQRLENSARVRIGNSKFYALWSAEGMKGKLAGNGSKQLYYLEESLHLLFNAHDALAEGMEIVDESSGIHNRYDYYYYDPLLHEFIILSSDTPLTSYNSKVFGILARKPKKVFKWRNDRAPKREDADTDAQVSVPSTVSNTGCMLMSYDVGALNAGLPWSTTEDTEHFTADNPAPPFYEQR